MPGNVANAAPSAVFPFILYRNFAQGREYPSRVNAYRDGTRHVYLLGTTSRKFWRISANLTKAQVETLRDFFLDRRGPTEPFFFYDPWDSNFTHDPTGVNPTGRYTVRFHGMWIQSSRLPRSQVSFELVEVN